MMVLGMRGHFAFGTVHQNSDSGQNALHQAGECLAVSLAGRLLDEERSAMDDILRAYLAGCMDCDGCFNIKRKTPYGDGHYLPRVSLWQTNPTIPYLLSQEFGGKVKKLTRKAPAKDIYRWEVTYSKAAALCEAVLPFLRIKKVQAQALLSLGETMDRRGYAPTGLPTNVIQLRQRFYDRVRALNHRGKPDLADVYLRKPDLQTRMDI